jgi:hypothetical protein
MNRLLLLLAILLAPGPVAALPAGARCGTFFLPARSAIPPAKPAVRQAARPFAVGDTLTFRAFDFASGRPYTLTATCRLVGHRAYWFVQDEEWGTRVRGTQIQRLSESFDGAGAVGSGIHGLGTETFGPLPDVDGDPRILVLVMDILDGYAATGNYLAGYFDSVNQAPPARREILYLDDRPLDLDSRLARSTLVHEIQHMIHWAADPTEEKWVDEGCSEYGERISGYADTTGVAAAFLSYPGRGLTEWQDLPLDYEKSMLFLTYFGDRFGRASVRSLVQNPAHGVAGFLQTMGSIPGAGTFPEFFADWAAANLLDAAGRYGYPGLALAPLTTEKMTFLPLAPSPRRVPLLAAQYYDFGKQQGLRVGFEGARTDTFRVRLVTLRSGSPGVIDMVLDGANRGSLSTVRADRVVALVARTGGATPGGHFTISADPFAPGPAALCDFDGDGSVGFGDFFLFAERFGTRSGEADYDPLFDLDGDGTVALEDFFRFALRFGERA